MARRWVGWFTLVGTCAVVLTASAQVVRQQRRLAGPGDVRGPAMRPAVARPSMPPGGDPAVEKAMARLMAARALVRLELTAEDLGKIIDPLRQVARRDGALHDEVLKLIAGEERAALSGRPGARVEDGLPESVRRAQYDHRQAIDRAWEAVVQSIGPRKAMGLRGLVEPQMAAPVGPMPGMMGMPGMPGMPGMEGMQGGPGMPGMDGMPGEMGPPDGSSALRPPNPGFGAPSPPGGGPPQMMQQPGLPPMAPYPGNPGMMRPMVGPRPPITFADLLDLVSRRLDALKR